MHQPDPAPISQDTPYIGPDTPRLPLPYFMQHGTELPGAVTVQDGLLSVVVTPELGGQLAELSIKLGEGWVRVTPELTPGFLMVPYSNRIRDGKFSFDGHEYQLARGDTHALHGDGRYAEWRVLEATKSKLSLSFSSAPEQDDGGYYANFPFAYVAIVTYEVKDGTLIHSLEIKNTGWGRMPAGGGMHPYFLRSILEGEDVQLQFRAKGEYPVEGDVPIPIGPITASPPSSDFSGLKGFESELDTCFGGWDGKAVLYWPESRIKAKIEASSTLKHLVIYAPSQTEGDESFFCFEPVANMTDGVNHLEDPEFDTGVVILKPGGVLRMSYTIGFEVD